MEIYTETFVFDEDVSNQPLDALSFNIPNADIEKWKDHFEQGIQYLQHGGTNLAEKSVSEALKILSASQNTSDLNKKKATCFHTMAEIYSIRGSQQVDENEFCEMMVKSIALMEAERIYKHGCYKEDEEINTAISNAEESVVEKVFGSSGVERFRKAGDKRMQLREKLNEIRLRVADEYLPSLAKFPDWNSELEEERCHEIEKMYGKIHDEMKDIFIDIFHHCSEVAGPAPCNYSIIGLGSVSRKEITPYSDLEFAILVGDEKVSQDLRQYFRNLTYFVYLQMIKLGETVLPSVAISSLNDFYSKNKEDDWFYDDVIPKGISFDGMMPWACKTPLGRKEWRGQPPQEYIMTIDEMLGLQNVIPGSSIENIKTANVFSSVCHLYGDGDLTKRYKQKLSVLLTHADRMRNFQEQVTWIMASLLQTYKFHGISEKDFGAQQDVKNEVYRLTSILVEQLSKFFGIFGENSWECIQEMGKKVLSKNGVKNLLVALSITTELRLECYMKQGRQKEALPTVPQLSMTEEENDPSPFTTAIVRLYQSLIPLKLAICQILKVTTHCSSDTEELVAAIIGQDDLLDVSPALTGVAYLRILQLPKALDCLLSAKENRSVDKVVVLDLLSRCYPLVGKFDEALECCREVQTLYENESHVVTKDDLLGAMWTKMDTFTDQGLYQQAMKIHDEIMHFIEKEELEESFFSDKNINFLNSSAVLFMETKQYKKAEVMLRRILKKKPKSNKKVNHFEHFMYLNNLAVVLLREDRFLEAKSLLDDALETAIELYGENAVHPYFARCLTNLAEVHYYMRNLKEAERCIQLALIIYCHVHENQLIEPGIVDALKIQAQIYQSRERWDDMYCSLMKAKKIAEMLYKNVVPHQNVASVLFYLGCCEQERGNCSEAVKYYQEYLKIHENRREEREGVRHDCRAGTVLVRIANLERQSCGDPLYIQSCLEKAIAIEEKIHGKNSTHGHLAICLGSLGFFLIKQNVESKGLEYLSKAMEMFEEINLDSSRIYGDAQLTIGKLLGEHSPYKAEKHLRTAQTVLKKILKDDNHITLLQISSSLLHIFLQTNRIEEAMELAKKQQRLIDTLLSSSTALSSNQSLQVLKLAEFYQMAGKRNTARKMYLALVKRLEEQVDASDPKKEIWIYLLWQTQQRVGAMYQADGMFYEAEAMFQRIASSLKKTNSKSAFVEELRHLTLWHQATIFTETRRYTQALELLDDLIHIYDTDPQSILPEIASPAFFARGELYRRCSRLEDALNDLEKALKIAKEFKDIAVHRFMPKLSETYHASIMNAIGLVYEARNDLKRALECYLCCLNTVDGIQTTVNTATFYQNAADILRKLGQLDSALLHYKKSLEIRELLHSEDPIREDIATVLYHMAAIHCSKENAKDASGTLDKLIYLRKELLKKGGSLQNYCAAFILKGNYHIGQPGEVQQAKEAYQEAEKVLERMAEGQPNLEHAVVISNLGYACFLLNETEQAISKLQKALEMKMLIYSGTPALDLAVTIRLLADALLKKEEYERALQYYEEALVIYKINQSDDDETECLLSIALCHIGLKNFDKALDNFKRVEELCVKEFISVRMRLYVHLELADVFNDEEFCVDRSKVLWHLKQAEAILNEMKQSDKYEEKLTEVQAKILSLEIA